MYIVKSSRRLRLFKENPNRALRRLLDTQERGHVISNGITQSKIQYLAPALCLEVN